MIEISCLLPVGIVGLDDLPYPLLAHLYPFFRSLDAFISDAISTVNLNLSEDMTYEVQYI